jgi:PAS domain S-box-containing protein
MHQALRFLEGGGRATALIRGRDWSQHPLGPPATWPDHFKTALSLVLNSPESMILCWGADLHFFFNETYFPLLGPRLSWAMGARFDEVWADALGQAMPIIEAAFAGEAKRFTDLPWKLATDRGAADTWWTFSYSRVLAPDGEIAGLFIFTNETTQRVLADARLRDSQQALEQLNSTLEQRVLERTAERNRLWDSSPDLLAVFDFKGFFQRVNPAWETVLGRRAESLLGTHFDQLLHPDDTDRAKTALLVATEGPMPIIQNRYRHVDGSYRWISWVAAPANGAVYATGRDITAEKRAQEALQIAEARLQQAQKVEALGQLTGGVAHDFNNFLTIIRGSVDLLTRPNLTEERRQRCIKAISDTADRASRLTGQLLAFARQQTLEPEVFAVGAQIESLREMLKTLTGPRIRLVFDVADESLLTLADQTQFDVAIVNLAVNARDAMNGEGLLSIAIAGVRAIPERGAHRRTSGDFVRITIRDSGTGIPPEHLDKIFEPFFTTKSVGHGTGLGLSQVFGFARQSGGDVLVESQPGAGSVFSLYLPRVASRPDGVQDRQVDAAAAAHPQSHVVLVVEHQPALAAFAVEALADLGYRPLVVADAPAALEKLAVDEDSIDAVFSTVSMPDMSGIGLLQAIRSRYPTMPVILAGDHVSVMQKANTHVQFLQKPYTLDQLARALVAVLR